MAGMSEDREDVAPVLTVTPEARATVLEVLANESEPDTLALWLEVSGEANGAYTYDMYFQAIVDAGAGDVVQPDAELPVVVPSASVGRLQGASLDFVTDASGEGGLVIVNPNTPPAPTLAGLARSPRSTCRIPSPSGWWPSSRSRSTPASPPTAVGPTWWPWRTRRCTCGSAAGARDVAWPRPRCPRASR